MGFIMQTGSLRPLLFKLKQWDGGGGEVNLFDYLLFLIKLFACFSINLGLKVILF